MINYFTSDDIVYVIFKVQAEFALEVWFCIFYINAYILRAQTSSHCVINLNV